MYKVIVLILIFSFMHSSIYPPVYSEFTEFLEYDYTNLHKSNNNVSQPYEDRYNCVHFSRDLIDSAKNAGYKMYPTALINTSSGSGHMLTAIRMNNSWIFIEPQNDMIFSIDELHAKYNTYEVDILKNMIIMRDGVELYPLLKI